MIAGSTGLKLRRWRTDSSYRNARQACVVEAVGDSYTGEHISRQNGNEYFSLFSILIWYWLDDCVSQDQVCLGRLVGCVRNVLVARWGWLMWGDRVSIDTAHTDTTNHCHAPVNPFYRNFNVCHRYLKILCSTALRGGQTGHSAIYRQSKSWKSCFLYWCCSPYMHIGLMPTNESKTAQPEVFYTHIWLNI